MTSLLSFLAIACVDPRSPSGPDHSASLPTSSASTPSTTPDPSTPTGEPSQPTTDTGPAPVGPFEPNPTLAGLAAGTWLALDLDGIEIDGQFAYSGGAYDRVHHQFLVFGGGHADGWRNDVLAFDISTATWQAMYPPTPESDYRCDNVDETTPGMLLSSGMPASRHSYDQIEFIDHLGAMIVWSGTTWSGIWGCPGNTLPADTWLYDPAANGWSYKNVGRGPQPTGEGWSGGYDPIGERYYAYAQGVTWSYDEVADRWDDVRAGGQAPEGYDLPITTDRSRRQLYRLSGASLFRYDIPSNRWEDTGATGTPPPSDHYVASYDEQSDVLVVAAGTAIWVYHIDTNAWEMLASTGGSEVTSSEHVNQRFFYDPVDDVHLLITLDSPTVTYGRAQTWAYKYR
ncbi:MAG: hypothetical protein ABMB14_04310 [Myxococcota bacterium]